MKLIAVALVVVAVFVLLAFAAKQQPRGRGRIDAKTMLTRREQAMYFRLKEALPNDLIVFAQVSFSALLKSPDQAARNAFNRKMADFVVLKKSFEVVAVIEVDDASHRGREKQDQERDAMLTEAGYRVIRYANVPDVEQVKADFDVLPPVADFIDTQPMQPVNKV